MEIRLVAWSEPAGKYDPKAPLEGNEDNMFVNPNLADSTPVSIQSDVILPLGDFGCLMVVADGMGGMNAGEVASAIAIETVKSLFGVDRLSSELASSAKGRKRYLEFVIKEADKEIKKAAKQDPDKEGMGSTIILAWLAEDGLTVSWCGDSRAYLFNTKDGLKLLSEDHSYVQDLVKAHKLEYVDTFDHPQGNLITRSLGDPSKSAEPETREFSVEEGDIILLCSDGLSGVLRDRKTKDRNGEYYPGDNIEDIINNHQDSLIHCREALFEAAEKADWYDNVTVVMCKIAQGQTMHDKKTSEDKSKVISLKSAIRSSVILVVLSLILAICGYHYGINKGKLNQQNLDNTIISNLKDSLDNLTKKTDVSIDANESSTQVGKEKKDTRIGSQKSSTPKKETSSKNTHAVDSTTTENNELTAVPDTTVRN